VNGISHIHVIQCCYGSSEASFNTCTQHGQTGFEHSDTHIPEKIGTAIRSQNSSQKHAATNFVNCEVCEWATQHARLPM
jgi:hypothetical protein